LGLQLWEKETPKRKYMYARKIRTQKREWEGKEKEETEKAERETVEVTSSTLQQLA
jgi:hypothetical protein